MTKHAPAHWATVEFGDVAKIVGGGTPPSKEANNFTVNGGVPWVTPADLSGVRVQYVQRGARNLTEQGFAACSAVTMPAGAVLFSSRAPIGYVAIAANEIATNQGFKSFVLPAGLESRYVYYYLRHIKPLAESMATGTTFKELSGATAARLPLLVAPEGEQRRIADKLDAMLARTDACRKRLDRVPKLIQRFRQSVLHAATSGALTIEWRNVNGVVGEYEVRPLDALLSIERGLKTGPFGTLLTKADHVRNGVSVVGIENIDSGKFIEGSKIKITSAKASELAAYDLRGGDIVISRSGTVGEICVVPPGQGDLRFSTNIIRVGLNRQLILPEYFVLLFRGCTDVLEQVKELCKGSTRIFLNQTILKSVRYPVPSMDEQREIIRQVDRIFNIADDLERHLSQANKTVERITPSLLAKAFRGELVPQDPNDEPVAELLKRLSDVRESSKALRSRRVSAVSRKPDSEMVVA